MRTIPIRSHRRSGRVLAPLVALSMVAAACGDDESGDGPAMSPETSVVATTLVEAAVPPSTSQAPPPEDTSTTENPAPPQVLSVVVVTYSVLGDMVSRLVGDAARVVVMVPNGMDPHDYEPSARDIETLNRAVFVVANGLSLEEGLERAIRQASAAGVPVFEAADHVALTGADDDDHDHDHDHDHGGLDPHFWLDPVSMAAVIPTLAQQLGNELGLDLTTAAVELVVDLEALHEQLEAVMGQLDGCRLVTGHDSLGYFAARYGCEVIGAVIPSLSTTAEASAGELAELRRVAGEGSVSAIFTELGTPERVAQQIARELDVPVVELNTHRLPVEGGYEAMMLDLAQRIADAHG